MTSAGKLLLRLPMSLHARAKTLAKAEGVSLNQFILACVAEKLGKLSIAETFVRQKQRHSDATSCPTCNASPRGPRCPTKCDENH